MSTVLRPNFNLPSHRKGDTFRALQFTLKQNGEAVDLTGASVLFQVRTSPTGTLVLGLEVGDGITITDALGGVFTIDEQVIDIASALYYYELEVTLDSGFRLTYLTGTWQIIQDVAR